MSRWKLRAGLFVLFLSGVLIGVCGTLIAGKRIIARAMSQGPTEVRGSLVSALSWHLKLSDPQRAKADVLLAGMQHDFLALRIQHQKEIRGTLDRTISGLVPVLDDAQQVKMKVIQARLVSSIERWPEWQKEIEKFLAQHGESAARREEPPAGK